MSTSADKRRFLKRARNYGFSAAFLLVFHLVYQIFAHGVDSPFMTFAFLIPLLGGSLVELAFLFLPAPDEIGLAVWPMGIATIAVGSVLHGVFDIYGGSSDLVNVFFVSGVLLIALATVLYVLALIRRHRAT